MQNAVNIQCQNSDTPYSFNRSTCNDDTNSSTKSYRRVDNRLGDKKYIEIVENEKCLCKQAHNSTVGYNATIDASVYIHNLTKTVNFNIYIY